MTKIIRIPCGIVNCYLVRQKDACILIDTAYGTDAGRIEHGLRRHGVHPGQLRLLFLTHGHIDHAGSAPYFKRRYGTPVAMNPVEDLTERPFWGQGLSDKAIWALTRATVRARGPVSPDVPLEEGMDLATFGISARVVALPGHTAGSMGLLLPGGRLLCGDAFSHFGKPHLSRVAEDTADLRQSAARLRRYKLKALYPGHGGPFAAAVVGL